MCRLDSIDIISEFISVVIMLGGGASGSRKGVFPKPKQPVSKPKPVSGGYNKSPVSKPVRKWGSVNSGNSSSNAPKKKWV